jgi:hypothetical protein
MALAFAKDTEVEPSDTRAEIEKVLKRVGAKRFGFVHDDDQAQIAFEHQRHRYRFTVAVPREADVMNLPDGSPRQYRHIANARAQLERTRWRTLLLGIKARMAEIECGIATFEQAFLAETILGDGRTVYETVVPELDRLEPGPLLRLLGGPA